MLASVFFLSDSWWETRCRTSAMTLSSKLSRRFVFQISSFCYISWDVEEKKQTNHETRKEKKLLKLFKIFTLFKAGVKYCDITEKQDKKISNLWFDMFLYLLPSMPTWVTHSYALSSFLPYWSQNIYETAQGGKMLMWQLILLPVSNTLPQVVFLSLC